MSPGRRRQQRQPRSMFGDPHGLPSNYGRFRSVMGKLTWDTATDVRPSPPRIVRDRRASNGRERLRGWRARPRGELGRPQALPANAGHRGTNGRRVSGREIRTPAPGSKIVAAGFGKREKRGGHDGADRVATDVLSPGVAAAVSKEAGHGIYRAEFKPVTEHVTGRVPPTGAITAVVPQHCCLRVGVAGRLIAVMQRLCVPVKNVSATDIPCCAWCSLLERIAA